MDPSTCDTMLRGVLDSLTDKLPARKLAELAGPCSDEETRRQYMCGEARDCRGETMDPCKAKAVTTPLMPYSSAARDCTI